MFKTERNSPNMGARVLRAFKNFSKRRKGLRVVFEHGQWWVTIFPSGAIYAVEDAEGIGSFDGFCFERIDAGDSE